MNYKIYPDSKNYTCQVVKIKNLRKHSNADRLQVTTIQGSNVICGLDVQIGDLMLYFPVESQLGKDFAEKNDLIRRKDEEGKNVGGLFENSRRIKALKLRGEKSEGYICPLSYLDKLGIDSTILAENSEFNELSGIEICRKYVINSSLSSSFSQKTGRKAKEDNKLIQGQFSFHYDTDKLAKNIVKFKTHNLIVITQKMHGSSGSFGRVLCKRKLKWYEKFLLKCGINISTTQYDNVYSSRLIIKNSSFTNHYYDEDIWTTVNDRIKDFIENGITLYGEIVGYTSTGKYIQKGYNYGCKERELDFYVYRITSTNQNGKIIEFTKNQKNALTKI